MTNVDINIPKLVGKPEIIKVNDSSFISVAEYLKRGNYFYDITLNNNNEEIFLGRFFKDDNILKVMYRENKIIVVGFDFINSIKDVAVTKVYLLYDVMDDVVYSVSEEKALELFNPLINKNHLKNEDTLIIRSDVEKRYRLAKKGK